MQGEGFLQPGAFPSAEYCGTCHQEAYSQWRQALHSNAFRTPFYRTSVNLLIRDKTRGIAFARHCDSCHNPIGVLGAALTEDSKVDRAKFDSDGLTCTTCHSVLSLDSTNGNASVEMGVPAVIVDENGDRIPGEVPFDMILRHPERHSKAVMHDFLHTAGVLRRLPQGQSARHAQRLQIHSRLHGVRRVAAIQVLAAQSADFLYRRLHHLPGLPHEAQLPFPCPTTARRTAPLSRIAGWPATPLFRSTMALTSN